MITTAFLLHPTYRIGTLVLNLMKVTDGTLRISHSPNQPDEGATQSYHKVTPLSGNSEFTAIVQLVSGHEMKFRDTGLGFMECGSSDSDEDAEHQMFEEYSDSSSTSSESESTSETHRTSKPFK